MLCRFRVAIARGAVRSFPMSSQVRAGVVRGPGQSPVGERRPAGPLAFEPRICPR